LAVFVAANRRNHRLPASGRTATAGQKRILLSSARIPVFAPVMRIHFCFRISFLQRWLYTDNRDVCHRMSLPRRPGMNRIEDCPRAWSSRRRFATMPSARRASPPAQPRRAFCQAGQTQLHSRRWRAWSQARAGDEDWRQINRQEVLAGESAFRSLRDQLVLTESSTFSTRLAGLSRSWPQGPRWLCHVWSTGNLRPEHGRCGRESAT